MISDREGQPHRLVIGIAQADRKAHIAVLVIEVQRAEHLHAVRRNGVFVADYLDVTKAQGFRSTPAPRRSAEWAYGSPLPVAPESFAIHREKFWLCRNGQ